jgi:hypothetical protein
MTFFELKLQLRIAWEEPIMWKLEDNYLVICVRQRGSHILWHKSMLMDWLKLFLMTLLRFDIEGNFECEVGVLHLRLDIQAVQITNSISVFIKVELEQ